MILAQVNWRGKVVKPYQIKNNKCFYFQNGKEVHFPYVLSEIPDFYVAGEALHSDASVTKYDEASNSIMFNSLYHFKVSGDTLLIN